MYDIQDTLETKQYTKYNIQTYGYTQLRIYECTNRPYTTKN